ncbi:polysaccharide deacetylase PdaB family [Caldinitratiruptor microaerophilus]|uniref:Polysaccharide deacetylase PdaB family n=1 Tax=Caldinitratiruptor microaerophilus TaxID=671077 RepID=A0AA35G688_9FIRM|nr:polysaccharide deacetylase PdaB family [Caldinitratiruptor microaerophilus]
MRRFALVGGIVVAAAAVGYPVLRAPVPEREVAPASAQGMPAHLRPIYSARTADPVLALTFDISWGNRTWPKVLEILEKEQVRATFFLSGPWAQKHPEAVKQIVAGGHEIASHGHRHDNFSRLGRAGTAENIQTAHAILREVSGREPRLIRPPNGDFDAVSLQATRDVGYETVIWSVDSLDWKNPGVGVMVQRVLSLAHPGAIVLFHASDSSKQVHEALPRVIRGLRQKGYAFMTVGEMLARYGPDPTGCIRVPGRTGC